MSAPILTYHHQVNVLIAICAAFFVVRGPIAVIDAYDLIRWLKRRRSRPDSAWRTPAAEIRRPSQRPADPWMDPIMPDDSQIRRYGNPDYGPPHIEPAHRAPGRPPANRKAVWIAAAVGAVVIVVAATVTVALVASKPKAHPAAASATSAAPAVVDTPTPDSPTPTADDVTGVGNWATAEDGVKIRVSKLARGHVSDIASGGHPGDPAVRVTVQVMNGGSSRLDLSQIQVEVRLGDDGRESDEVFQDGYDGTPSGSLAVGKTSTSVYLFDAQSKAELDKVAVDVAPGFSYNSVTYEGSV